MPLDLIFIAPGNYTVNDDGIFGNNTSVIRDATNAVIFTFMHPADSMSLTTSTANVNLALDLDDALTPATFRIGDLTDPAKTLDAVSVQRVVAAAVILAANQTITEIGSDAAADIVASSLVLSAVSGVGTLANALESQTGLLEAETTTGGINITNFGAVQIGGVSDEVNGLSVATSGDLNLINFGSIFLGEVDLDIANPPPPALESVRGGSTSGNVSLTANGISSDIIANTDTDAITASAGSIVVVAGRDIAFGSIGANFDNDVRASGSLTFTAGRDFIVDGFADIASDGFGQNTGGNLTITAGRNIHVRDVTGTSASVSATGNAGADLILTTGQDGALISDAPTTDALSSTSGDVLVHADRVLIDSLSRIAAPSGQIVLETTTIGRDIVLGSAGDTAAAMELSDAELDRLFSPTLTIGGPTAGNLSVIGAISPTTPTSVTFQADDIQILAAITVAGALTLKAGDDVLALATTITATSLSVFVDQTDNDNGTGGFADLSAVTLTVPGAFAASLFGNADGDRLTGSNLADQINGGASGDVLNGAGGNDSLFGGPGGDVIFGGLGRDTLVGNDNVFLLDPDTMSGEDGDDTIFAERSDTVNGGTGTDTLIAINAFDFILDMGTTSIEIAQMDFGNDTINASTQIVAVTISASGGNDTVFGSSLGDFITGGAGGDSINGAGGNDTIFAGPGGDLVLGGAGQDTLVGNDDIFALDPDTLFGEEGNDSIYAERSDTINGGTGTDIVYAVNSFDFTLDMGATSFEIAQMDFGNDVINASTQTVGVTVIASGGNDTVTGSPFADLVFAGVGNDILTGNGGSDTLVGQAGADTLSGGAGIDVLYGNAGSGGDGVQDIFKFQHAGAANADAVYDFQAGIDKIDLTAFGGNTFANVSILDGGGSSNVYLNGQIICTVVGAAGTLTFADFFI